MLDDVTKFFNNQDYIKDILKALFKDNTKEHRIERKVSYLY